MKKTHFAVGTMLIWVAVGAGCAEPPPDKLLEMARAAVVAGEQRTAEIHLKNLLRQEPNNAAARHLLGQVALDLGDPIAAEAALRRAIELGTDPAEVQLPLVRALLAQGRNADALRQIANGPELTGEDRIAELRMEGAAHRALDHTADAEASFRAALEIDPANLGARTDLATLMLAQNRTEEARRLIVAVLTDEATYGPALVLRGMLEYADGRLDQAEATLREVVEREGTSGDSYFGAMLQLTEVLTAKGDLDAADEVAAKLLSANPNHPVAIALMADVEIREGELDSAKKRLEQVLSGLPDLAVANRLLGIVNARQGQVQQAQMRLQRALAQAPGDLRSRLQLARLHLDQNNADAARAALTASRDDARSNTVLFALAARTAFQLHERELGTRFLEESERLAVDGTPEEQLAVAGALMDAGERERASALLQGSAESGVDNAWLSGFGLALAQVNSRQYAAADATIVGLIEALPGAAWPHNLRGMAAAAAQNFDAALGYFSTALELAPNDVPTRLNRARVELLAGRRADAVADYNAVLERSPNNANALAALAELALADRNFAEVERLTALMPEAVARLRLEGAAAFGQGRVAEAAQKLARAFEMQPTADHALQAFAAAQRAGDPMPEAPLLTWLAEYPRDAKVNLALGLYWLQKNDHDRAIASYETVLEVAPDQADALNNLAWLYDQRGDRRALPYAERAHAAAPDSPAIADTLGWLYVRNDQVRKGLPLLEESHTALPQNAEIHYHWAAALAEAGEEDRAVQALRELLAAHESFGERADAERLLQRLE